MLPPTKHSERGPSTESAFAARCFSYYGPKDRSRPRRIDTTSVATAVWECAVEVSIDDERNGHSMGIERGGPEGIAYTFRTSTDASGCFE